MITTQPMYKKLLNYIFASLSVLLLTGVVAHAQSSGAVPDPVQYTVSPETPGPSAQVTLVVQGVGGFIGNSMVTWSVGGKVAASGTGVSTYTLTAGSLGQTTTVHVVINSQAQGTITHDFVILPTLVDLVWEADTSAPPLYRGKPLYSAGSALKVVAYPIIIINGTRIAADSLSFQWTLGDIPAAAQSGLGHNTFSFTGDQLQPEEDASVDVYLGSLKVGHGEVIIPTTNPMLLLYDQDPLRGTLFDTALPAGISLSASEFTVYAAPYYFANSSLQNNALTYAWTLDGNDTTGPAAAKGALTLRQTGSGTGGATLGVSLQNNDSDKIIQEAEAALQIVFGAQSSGSSLFGL